MSDLYPEIILPDAEPGIIPWSEIGAMAEVTGAAFDADGTPLDTAGNRIEPTEAIGSLS